MPVLNASAQSNQPLRWNLKQGEKLSVVLEQNTGVKTTLGNRAQETGNEMIMSLNWEVTSVENGFVIKQSVERIQLTINTPSENGLQTTTLDTASDDNSGQQAQHLLEQVRPLIGTVHNITMSPRGEITGVSLPKESKEAIRTAPASMQIRQVFSENGIKELLGQGAIVFPAKSIEAGAEWKSNKSVRNGLGELTTVTTYSYDGREGDGADSADQFKVLAELTNKKLNKEVESVNFSGKGKIRFAAEAKMVLDSELSNEMTTKRTYRETIIETTVTTEVKTKVNRDNG